MADGEAFSALTLLLAVCEQTLLELEDVNPPLPALSAHIGTLRDVVHDALTSDRFRTAPECRNARAASGR